MNIEKISPADLNVIQGIAHKTWPETFADILSPAQIAYMLEWMYSIPSLTAQVNEKGHHFILASEEQQPLGFASYELNYQGEAVTKIHKIYILPNTQGKGIGKALINQIAETARQHANTALVLNVNRYNKAVQFYQHIGFKVAGQEDIDIGQGFLMEDYIMKQPL